MSYKRYILVRIIGVIIVATLGVLAATTGNMLILIPPALAIGVLIYFFSRRVREVVVDERINSIAHKATRLAFLAFVILAVVIGAILIALSQESSSNLYQIGLTLNFSVCAILVMYWIAYIYYNRKLGGKE
ncbi:DUF2178 domain-containing protein [Chloroflexota bacterium]